MAQVVGAPQQQSMDAIEAAFAKHEALLVKQTMRGCLQECLGCEAKSEYKISGFDMAELEGVRVSEAALKRDDEMYATEESSLFCRCCWRDGRPFNMAVSGGGAPGGSGVVNYNKPCSMPLQMSSFPCCFMLPKVETTTPEGAPLGSESEYICDACLFVPKLKYSENGQAVYILRPETCCGGCCVACDCVSCKGLAYTPFFFHDPETMQPVGGYEDKAPQIRKVWAGFKKECFSTADTFMVKFPPNTDSKRKAGLLGLSFLLDFAVFERQQEDQ